MLNFFRRKKVATAAPKDPWIIASSEEDGFPVLSRFRGSVPEGVIVGSYPQLINLFWSYSPGREQAMPGDEDYERMLVLESHLDKIEDSGIGYLMLSVTGNFRKEWILYVQTDSAFLSALNTQLQGQSRFPIEIESASDPEWRNYFGLMSRMREN